jgi:hypothetical protein
VISGEHVIIDIRLEEMELEYDDDDGAGWLAALAPLRADLLCGDLRLFYLLWLMAVQYGLIDDFAVEPLPGIAPLTDALERFAAFFDIDSDLVEAAAERGVETAMTQEEVRGRLSTITDAEKLDLLARVAQGDPYVGVELKARLCRTRGTSIPPRTAADLRQRAQDIAQARVPRPVSRARD